MGERLIVVWAAIVMGTSSVRHAGAVRHGRLGIELQLEGKNARNRWLAAKPPE